MLGDGTGWNYFYYVPLYFKELCFRGRELGACWYCVRPQRSWKSTWQARAQTEVNGVLALLKLKPGFQFWCQRGSLSSPSSSYAARTGCVLSLSRAYHKYSNADLVTRKLNYRNTLSAEPRARLLSAARRRERGSTCAQPRQPAATRCTALPSSHCLPPKRQIDFKLALSGFKALNNAGSGDD